MFKRNMLVFMLSLFAMNSCWAKGMKGNLEGNEINYFNTTFTSILIKANICKKAGADCENYFVICGSFETLACTVYGITDEKVIKELFISMLNSGLRFSSITFYRSRYHKVSIFERPILDFTDHTGGK